MSQEIEKAHPRRGRSAEVYSTPNKTLFRSAERVVLWLLGGTVLGTGAAVMIFELATGRWPDLVVSQSFARDAFAVAAGVGAAIGLVVSYRRQKSVEDEALTQRYSSAADQMGHVKAAVRLAGVTAMARLADDWEQQRQMCVDVLCAYLRMPCDTSDAHQYAEEGQVRKTVMRLIANHVKEKGVSGISWSNLDFDLSGSVLEGVWFDEAAFSGVVSFIGATFSSVAWFELATFSSEASFIGATFSSQTSFGEATFSGWARFIGATFSGGAWFELATFSSVASFGEATFSGETSFDGATFSSVVSFIGATYLDSSTGQPVPWQQLLSGIPDPPPANFKGLDL